MFGLRLGEYNCVDRVSDSLEKGWWGGWTAAGIMDKWESAWFETRCRGPWSERVGRWLVTENGALPKRRTKNEEQEKWSNSYLTAAEE